MNKEAYECFNYLKKVNCNLEAIIDIGGSYVRFELIPLQVIKGRVIFGGGNLADEGQSVEEILSE